MTSWQIFIAEYPNGSCRMKGDKGKLKLISVDRSSPDDAPSQWLVQLVGPHRLPERPCTRKQEFSCQIVGALQYVLPENSETALRGAHSALVWPWEANFFWKIWHSPADAFFLRITDRFRFKELFCVTEGWSSELKRPVL